MSWQLVTLARSTPRDAVEAAEAHAVQHAIAMPHARRAFPLAAVLLVPALATCALVAGCGDMPGRGDDVVGPFTGTRHRFVIDRFAFPTNHASAKSLGDDLDGDRVVDNQVGMVIATLSTMGDITSHAPDMIASGVLASTIEIVAGDLVSEDRAGVWYYGADGTAATPVGGQIVDRVFTSNRTRTSEVPGRAVLRLPVFVDADPAEIELIGMEIDLTPDGRGGFDGLVRGAFRSPDALAAARDGIVQMLDADPQDHRTAWWLTDLDRNGDLTLAETGSSKSLIGSLLAPDVTLPGHDEPTLSLGFAIHVSPCAAGRCSPPPTDTCFDRVRTATETGVDCGGACRSCPGGEACKIPADCQSESCDDAGRCRPPSCFNQRVDGFESDLDCGGICGTGCRSTQACDFDSDCDSNDCDSAFVCR
jgi:hypothetical protein